MYFGLEQMLTSKELILRAMSDELLESQLTSLGRHCRFFGQALPAP